MHLARWIPLLPATAVLALSLSSCAPRQERPQVPAPGLRSFTVLAVNDVYRIEGVDDGTAGGLARLRSLRAELEGQEGDLLLLHAGDFLFPSLLSRSFDGAQMIDILNHLDGDGDGFDERMFVTFGNHEFDQDDLDEAENLDRRIEDSQFTWLDSDLDFVTGEDGDSVIASDNLAKSALLEIRGVRVGLFSISTDEKHPAYVERFGDPETVARQMTAELRGRGAEVVVALTHLSFSQDVELLQRLGDDGPDLSVGGHEHNRLHECVGGEVVDGECVGGRLIVKADAEVKTASVIRVAVTGEGPPRVSFEYRELDSEAPADAEVGELIESWIARHSREYCAEKDLSPGCLGEVLGRTNVCLIGEELEIRRFETNLGNWILDQVLGRFRDHGVVAAFVNSGSLRLNQNIPAGADVTLRHVEEIFQYPSELKILRVTGEVLQQAVSHAITDWTGSGHWLQISGFAFRHDPDLRTADRLTLLTPAGPRPIVPDEELLVVTSGFVAAGNDGFEMLSEDLIVPYDGGPVDLRDLVVAGLAAAADEGISPAVEGRICNTRRDGPCLAVER
ncbi:MAG: 5'-nucleotidase C-terminal domain-containing protein [Thermoanaerobaculia bacterium]